MNTSLTFFVACLLFGPQLAQLRLTDRAQIPEFDAASVRHVAFDAPYQGRGSSLTGGPSGCKSAETILLVSSTIRIMNRVVARLRGAPSARARSPHQSTPS